MKAVIAGGSGFIGRGLIRELQGWEIVLLERKDAQIAGVRVQKWDGVCVEAWAKELEGSDLVVNLAGAPIGVAWTEENREKILDSRIKSTQAVSHAIQGCSTAPACWVNGSAVGYYGDAGDRSVTEADPPGAGYLADVCKAWEAAAMSSPLPNTRRVLLRTGFVLGSGGGALPTLAKLAKWGLGGAAGSGEQWIPWIHLTDLCRLIAWCGSGKVTGPVNGCAPKAATNRELMKAVRHAVHRPWSPPVPAFALKALGKTVGPDSELLLDSQRVKPAVAIEGGFTWRYPDLQEAVREVLRDEG